MRKIKVKIDDYTYDWLRDIARQSGKRVEEHASELLRTHVSLEQYKREIREYDERIVELRREREKLENEIRELEAKRQKLQEQVRQVQEQVRQVRITTIATDEGYLILHDVGEEIIIVVVDIEAGRVASATTKPQTLKIFCREESEEGE